MFHHLWERWNTWKTIFTILSEKLSNFCVISRMRDFTIKNWSEEWFCEMLNIAFKREYCVNVNSLFTMTHECLTHFYIYSQCETKSELRPSNQASPKSDISYFQRNLNETDRGTRVFILLAESKLAVTIKESWPEVSPHQRRKVMSRLEDAAITKAPIHLKMWCPNHIW